MEVSFVSEIYLHFKSIFIETLKARKYAKCQVIVVQYLRKGLNIFNAVLILLFKHIKNMQNMLIFANRQGNLKRIQWHDFLKGKFKYFIDNKWYSRKVTK